MEFFDDGKCIRTFMSLPSQEVGKYSIAGDSLLFVSDDGPGIPVAMHFSLLGAEKLALKTKHFETIVYERVSAN